ncbi:hypothetical protein TSAR_003096 [Trichomalopsis sarcophagae]|uniref:Uncharacterized protein n=1 Tax=Trichomalopsis sarcophagae TaxID=543379 RepID=A0A232EG15_9HYME|nr:hypothetical protein TSAR_003096 [Trichomalopsis sarcophagae]
MEDLRSPVHKKQTVRTQETATSNLMVDLQRTQAENPKLFQMLQKSPVHQHPNDITRKNSTPNINKQPNKHQATNSSRHLSRLDENIPQAMSNLMADLQRTQAENPKLFQMLQKSPVHQHPNDITRKNSTPNVN